MKIIFTDFVMDEVIVRQAKTNDIESICGIIRQVVPLMNDHGNFQWNQDYPLYGDFEKDVANDELWVATCGNKIAGVIALSHEQPKEYFELEWDKSVQVLVPHRMAVHPDFRGYGIAKKLLQFAEDLALSYHINIIRVDTCTRNSATTKLFPSLGYIAIGEITLEGKPPDHKFMCYEKYLTLLNNS